MSTENVAAFRKEISEIADRICQLETDEIYGLKLGEIEEDYRPIVEGLELAVIKALSDARLSLSAIEDLFKPMIEQTGG